jgi:hypothetical protein
MSDQKANSNQNNQKAQTNNTSKSQRKQPPKGIGKPKTE